MHILHSDGVLFFSPKPNKHECINSNQLPAVSIGDWDLIEAFLDITIAIAEIQVIRVEVCSNI